MTRTFIRAQGEAYDADQLEGICEGCDLRHSRCACDPEPTNLCETCEGVLTFTGWCFQCDDFGAVRHGPLLGPGWQGIAA